MTSLQANGVTTHCLLRNLELPGGGCVQELQSGHNHESIPFRRIASSLIKFPETWSQLKQSECPGEDFATGTLSREAGIALSNDILRPLAITSARMLNLDGPPNLDTIPLDLVERIALFLEVYLQFPGNAVRDRCLHALVHTAAMSILRTARVHEQGRNLIYATCDELHCLDTTSRATTQEVEWVWFAKEHRGYMSTTAFKQLQNQLIDVLWSPGSCMPCQTKTVLRARHFPQLVLHWTPLVP